MHPINQKLRNCFKCYASTVYIISHASVSEANNYSWGLPRRSFVMMDLLWQSVGDGDVAVF